MSYLYEYELGKAADIIARELLGLKANETCIITADTESDIRVVDAVARAAFSAGAKPMVILVASPLGVGKAADAMLPRASLAAALKKTDTWVEFNNKYIYYSATYDDAYEGNLKLRHLCLEGMTSDNVVRCIGRVDFPVLEAFLKKVTKMTQGAKHIRMTTPAGEDVEFDNEPGREIGCEIGYAHTSGSFMQPGQIGWAPALETVNGVIVFDGAINPPIGILKEPVYLQVKNGEIVKFEGGNEAKEYERWLKSFNHPQMLRLAHVCYGFNPGARLSKNNSECERVWGATQWGIGNVGQSLIPGGVFAPSHSDGVCLNTSVWLDGVQIMEKGQVLEPELVALAKKLGKV